MVILLTKQHCCYVYEALMQLFCVAQFYVRQQVGYSRIYSEEGLKDQHLPVNLFTAAKLHLSTLLTKPNIHFHSPTNAAPDSFFTNFYTLWIQAKQFSFWCLILHVNFFAKTAVTFLAFFQGINFQLAAVLISIGTYAYIEHGKSKHSTLHHHHSCCYHHKLFFILT